MPVEHDPFLEKRSVLGPARPMRVGGEAVALFSHRHSGAEDAEHDPDPCRQNSAEEE